MTRVARRISLSTFVAALSLTAITAQSTPDRRRLTARLDADLHTPADNVPTVAVVALGRRLFFDPVLSDTGAVSCATCHDPARAFADDRPVAVGIRGRMGARNTPSLVNRAYGELFFWDGRATTLEAQVTAPIENPDELGSSVARVIASLSRQRSYVEDFRRAFSRQPQAADLARALASYVRTIQSADAPVDLYASGNKQAMSSSAQRGARVFRVQGLCVTCHSGPNFTDEKFHNTGIAWNGRSFADPGRMRLTSLERDRGAFKTPTLREVARTAPYMHDGSLATLEDVVEFYAGGGRTNPSLDSEVLRLNLTDADKAALVAFLRALSGVVTEGSASMRDGAGTPRPAPLTRSSSR